MIELDTKLSRGALSQGPRNDSLGNMSLKCSWILQQCIRDSHGLLTKIMQDQSYFRVIIMLFAREVMLAIVEQANFFFAPTAVKPGN